MFKCKKALVDFIGNIRIYWCGFVLFGNTTYKLKGVHWREILNLIQPGDIILNTHYGYLSSWFIKGDFSHAGLYVGDDEIIHVMTAGIIKEDILTFLRADDAAIIRVKDKSIIPTMIKKAHEQLARGSELEYDYDFNKQNTNQLYCSEFTDFCTGYLLREGVSKDKKYIFPDDYLIPSDLFDIIWQKEEKNDRS